MLALFYLPVIQYPSTCQKLNFYCYIVIDILSLQQVCKNSDTHSSWGIYLWHKHDWVLIINASSDLFSNIKLNPNKGMMELH